MGNCLIEKISSCDSSLCDPYESLGHSARVNIVYNNDTVRLLNFDHSLKTQFDCWSMRKTTNTREKHFQVFNKSSIDVNKIDAAGIRHDNENELYFRQTSA